MSKHEVEYDDDGLSKNDPWNLSDYLSKDGFTPRDRAVVLESVLSWLQQYENAGCDISEAVKELADV